MGTTKIAAASLRSTKRSISIVTLLSMTLILVPQIAFAAISITVITGSPLSLNNSTAATTGNTFTSLTGPAIVEGAFGDITASGGAGKSIILTAPAGFAFATTVNSVTATVTNGACSGGGNRPVQIGSGGGSATQTVTPTASTITIAVKQASAGSANCKGTITFTGIKVQPTDDSPLAATGNLTFSGTSSVSGNAGQLTEIDNTKPLITLTGANPQTINQGDAYVELGATATDDVDGSITGNIVIDSSAVNTAVVGSYSVTYDVSDAATNAATQVTRTVNVVSNASTTLLNSDVNPAIIGANVTFNATVYGNTPTGTVQFFDNGVSVGTGTLSSSGTGAVTTFSTSSLTLGTHPFTAVYSGDGNNATSSSANYDQIVNQSPTSSVNLSSANPSIVGQSVTFNATITGVSPTGNVTFFSGAVLLGTGSITTTTSTGAYASFSTSDLGVGTYSITARYNGDTNNEVSSSNTINVHVVNQSPTSTVNLSAPNPSYYGDSVTFTATIAGFNPTGDVDFFSGATLLGNVSVFGATATGAYATFSIATLTVGTNDIHAVYNGDTNNLVSTSNTVNMHVVDKSPTSSVNLSAPNPSTIGETVTFDATITGVSPTGTVSFFSGATLLGTVAISTTVSTGAYASFGTSSLPVGTHSVTAIYNGDGNNEISASNTVNVHVVNQFISTTIAFSGPTPTTVGTTVTFTATVYGYGNPTGIVTFYDNASAIGTGALIASGTGSEATFMTNALTVGNHNITGTYEGDINNTSGTSTAPIFVQVIDKSATVTTLVSSENPINLGGTVTFSVSVTGYFPTGTVSLTSNDTEIATGPLNASGTVTFDLSSFSAGTFTIVAHYLGDGNNYASDSDPLNQIVIGGVNGGMRRFRNLVRYLNGESNAGFGDVGLPFGAFGGPGPGGGTGELTADQLITMCSIHDKIIFLGALNVVDYMAEIYSHTFDVEEGIIADILRNGTDCSTGEETTGDEGASADASSLVAMDPKYTVTFPVAEDGYPLSSDQIWNVCIRNYQVFIAGEVKPINCNRYHEGHTWEHPDLHITFKWSDRFVKQIKVRGMQVATITVPTPKYIVQRSMETTNLNSLVGLANLAKKTLNFTDLLGSVQ